MKDRFESWWKRVGESLDPDTSDVPWFDKRKALAEAAFDAAMAQSRNYVADDAVDQKRFTFANGRVVESNTTLRLASREGKS